MIAMALTPYLHTISPSLIRPTPTARVRPSDPMSFFTRCMGPWIHPRFHDLMSVWHVKILIFIASIGQRSVKLHP